MLKYVSLVIIMALAAPLGAQEETCPGNRVGSLGFTPFEEFHAVMAPAWHHAWPEEDYRALFSAGSEFSDRFKKIAFLKPEFKTDARREAFLEHRREFAQLVRDYHEACRSKDSAAVMEIMPELHDAFEGTAATLLPVHYPEFEGFVVTLNLIIETHLPRNNREGLTGSTETLIRKAEVLSSETVPAELSEASEEVVKRQETFRELSHRLSQALADDDMDAFKTTLSQLEQEVERFIADFI